MLLVAVRVATVARYLAVAVARLAMVSTVSCLYSCVVSCSCKRLAEWNLAPVVVL